ncbi:hypothetical protein FS837_008064 [Tulasnella sp. UAMH 9824]|nr:hypothetical protein FS837_008064 [Tulasnella sp. UAMH 9824]
MPAQRSRVRTPSEDSFSNNSVASDCLYGSLLSVQPIPRASPTRRPPEDISPQPRFHLFPAAAAFRGVLDIQAAALGHLTGVIDLSSPPSASCFRYRPRVAVIDLLPTFRHGLSRPLSPSPTYPSTSSATILNLSPPFSTILTTLLNAVLDFSTSPLSPPFL